MASSRSRPPNRRARSTMRGTILSHHPGGRTPLNTGTYRDSSQTGQKEQSRYTMAEKGFGSVMQQREKQGEHHNFERMRQLRRLALKNIYTQRSQSMQSVGDVKKADQESGREEANAQEAADVIPQFAASQEPGHQTSVDELGAQFREEFGLIPKDRQSREVHQISSPIITEPVNFENQMIYKQTNLKLVGQAQKVDSVGHQGNDRFENQRDRGSKATKDSNDQAADQAKETIEIKDREQGQSFLPYNSAIFQEDGGEVIQNQNLRQPQQAAGKETRLLHPPLRNTATKMHVSQTKKDLVDNQGSLSSSKLNEDLRTLMGEGEVHKSSAYGSAYGSVHGAGLGQRQDPSRAAPKSSSPTRWSNREPAPNQIRTGIYTQSQINLNTKKPSRSSFKPRYMPSGNILHQISNLSSRPAVPPTWTVTQSQGLTLLRPEMAWVGGPTHHKLTLHQKQQTNQNHKVHKLKGIKVGRSKISRNHEDQATQVMDGPNPTSEHGIPVESVNQVNRAGRQDRALYEGFEYGIVQQLEDEMQQVDNTGLYDRTTTTELGPRNQSTSTECRESMDHPDLALAPMQQDQAEEASKRLNRPKDQKSKKKLPGKTSYEARVTPGGVLEMKFQRSPTMESHNFQHRRQDAGTQSSAALHNVNNDGNIDDLYDEHGLVVLMATHKEAELNRQHEVLQTLKQEVRTFREGKGEKNDDTDHQWQGVSGLEGGREHGGGMDEQMGRQGGQDEKRAGGDYRLRLRDRSIKLKPKRLSKYKFNSNYQKGQINYEYLTSKRTDTFQGTPWLETLAIKRMKSNPALLANKPSYEQTAQPQQRLHTKRESAPSLDFKSYPDVEQTNRQIYDTPNIYKQKEIFESAAYDSRKQNRKGQQSLNSRPPSHQSLISYKVQ